MLQIKGTAVPARESRADDSQHDGFDLRFLLGLIRMQKRLVITTTLILLAAGVIYVLVRPSVYTAHTALVVYDTKIAPGRDNAIFGEEKFDPIFLDTQLEILKSDKIALEVIDRLHLTSTRKSSFLSGIWPSFFSPESGGGADNNGVRQATLKAFKRNTSIERIGQSSAVEIAYTADTPEEASNVANAIASAYLAEQAAARAQAAQAASGWVRDRMKELGPRARIIASALPPIEKSNPRGILVLAILAFAGIGASIAFIISRQVLRQLIFTPEQAEFAAGVECIGIVPRLSHWAFRRPRDGKSGNSRVDQQDVTLAHALDRRQPQFWHVLREIGLIVDAESRSNDVKFIGLTSTFPGEGKTAVATNLARVLASFDKRVLTVDCNVYKSRSRRNGPEDEAGLIEILGPGEPNIAGHICADSKSGMHFLPLGGKSKAYFAQPLWTDAMADFLVEIRHAYDYVLFDLPALTQGADARVAAEYLDRLLLVIDWKAVSVEEIKAALRSSGSVQPRLLGSILNRVDLRKYQWLTPASRARVAFDKSAFDMPETSQQQPARRPDLKAAQAQRASTTSTGAFNSEASRRALP